MLIKHESPSDYVDSILSLKYKPAILICDMPDRIAKNLQKRCPSLLQPNLGMLAEPTAKNIELAFNKKLEVNLESLKPLKMNHSLVFDHAYNSNNPTTNTSKMYILYDEFHKVNSKKKSEIMRHVNLVPQLGFINTEISEQLNSIIGRNIYFLDKMDCAKHYFFLRLLIHFLNSNRNKNNKKKMKRYAPQATLEEDAIGRLFISLNTKNNVTCNAEEINDSFSSYSDNSCSTSSYDEDSDSAIALNSNSNKNSVELSGMFNINPSGQK